MAGNWRKIKENIYIYRSINIHIYLSVFFYPFCPCHQSHRHWFSRCCAHRPRAQGPPPRGPLWHSEFMTGFLEIIPFSVFVSSLAILIQQIFWKTKYFVGKRGFQETSFSKNASFSKKTSFSKNCWEIFGEMCRSGLWVLRGPEGRPCIHQSQSSKIWHQLLD